LKILKEKIGKKILEKKNKNKNKNKNEVLIIKNI
jgi:hypothetical protein